MLERTLPGSEAAVYIFDFTSEESLGASERLCRCSKPAGFRIFSADAHYAHHAPEGQKHECNWPEPQKPGLGLKGRLKENIVAVALDHESHHFVICTAGFNLLGHFSAQIHCQLSIRFRNSFVGTNQAPKLRCNVVHARIGCRIKLRGLSFSRFQVSKGIGRIFNGSQ